MKIKFSYLIFAKNLSITLDTYKAQVDKFLAGGSTGLKLHPIKPYANLYSIYLNKKARLLFFVQGSEVTALAVLENHEYEQWLKDKTDAKIAALAHRINSDPYKKLVFSDECEIEEAGLDKIAPPVVAISRYYNGQQILLSDDQVAAGNSYYILPMVISGPAGTGKSLIALEIMKNWQEANPSAKIYYLAQNPYLLTQAQENWPSFGNVSTRVHFVDPNIFLADMLSAQSVPTGWAEEKPGESAAEWSNSTADSATGGWSEAHEPVNVFVVFDEAQIATVAQLQEIMTAAHYNVVLLVGDHQNLDVKSSPIEELKIYLYHQGKSLQRHYLRHSYRNSLAVLKVADHIINLKYAVVGGGSDKEEMVGLKPGIKSDLGMGAAYWLSQNTIPEMLLAEGAVIIAPQQLIASLKSTYAASSGVIFTVKETQGLEFKKVIVFAPLYYQHAQEVSQAIQALGIKPEDIVAPTRGHLPKVGFERIDDSFFVWLHTAVTRAKEEVYIVQEKQRSIEPLFHSLKKEGLFKSDLSLVALRPHEIAESWRQTALNLLSHGEEFLPRVTHILATNLHIPSEEQANYIGVLNAQRSAKGRTDLQQQLFQVFDHFAMPPQFDLDAEHPGFAPLREHLGAQGLVLKNVPADGNCFFHALADQLNDQHLDGGAHTHVSVRAAIIDRLIALCHDAGSRDRLFEATGKTPDAYVLEMLSSHTWADGVIFDLAASVFNVELVLVQQTGELTTYKANEETVATLTLGYIDHFHFTSTRPLVAAEAGLMSEPVETVMEETEPTAPEVDAGRSESGVPKKKHRRKPKNKGARPIPTAQPNANASLLKTEIVPGKEDIVAKKQELYVENETLTKTYQAMLTRLSDPSAVEKIWGFFADKVYYKENQIVLVNLKGIYEKLLEGLQSNNQKIKSNILIVLAKLTEVPEFLDKIHPDPVFYNILMSYLKEKDIMIVCQASCLLYQLSNSKREHLTAMANINGLSESVWEVYQSPKIQLFSDVKHYIFSVYYQLERELLPNASDLSEVLKNLWNDNKNARFHASSLLLREIGPTSTPDEAFVSRLLCVLSTPGVITILLGALTSENTYGLRSNILQVILKLLEIRFTDVIHLIQVEPNLFATFLECIQDQEPFEETVFSTLLKLSIDSKCSEEIGAIPHLYTKLALLLNNAWVAGKQSIVSHILKLLVNLAPVDQNKEWIANTPGICENAVNILTVDPKNQIPAAILLGHLSHHYNNAKVIGNIPGLYQTFESILRANYASYRSTLSQMVSLNLIKVLGNLTEVPENKALMRSNDSLVRLLVEYFCLLNEYDVEELVLLKPTLYVLFNLSDGMDGAPILLDFCREERLLISCLSSQDSELVRFVSAILVNCSEFSAHKNCMLLNFDFIQKLATNLYCNDITASGYACCMLANVFCDQELTAVINERLSFILVPAYVFWLFHFQHSSQHVQKNILCVLVILSKIPEQCENIRNTFGMQEGLIAVLKQSLTSGNQQLGTFISTALSNVYGRSAICCEYLFPGLNSGDHSTSDHMIELMYQLREPSAIAEHDEFEFLFQRYVQPNEYY